MYHIFAISFVLIVGVYILFFLISYKNLMDMESVSPYECGFDPKSETRIMFSYRFFLIAILFLIFDVEIALMLPTPFMESSNLSMLFFYLFVFILIIGLMYEYYCGSLEWLM